MTEPRNSDCFCISLDRERLRAALDEGFRAAGVHRLVEERCPHLFAAVPVFVARRHVDEMAAIVGAVEEVTALPGYQEAALARAPEIARHDPGAWGAFLGYDFHLAADGPRLIEINTNPGGALLNAVLARAQRACCAEVQAFVSGPEPLDLEAELFNMFVAEWRRAGREGLPGHIAIVDEHPEEQFLYPEFLLFAQLFRRYGLEASVLAPQALAGRRDIALVYNRLTDFSLDRPEHAPLREAYLSGRVVVTPHPRAHALYADKRNLAALTDAARLRHWGAREVAVRTLLRGVPRTEVVSAEAAARLWSERRRLFFKPAGGYGSRAAYRGEKLTTRVWGDILRAPYVAQQLVAPSERQVAAGAPPMKVDVRNYAYRGKVQLLAARLYQGQTTNMRTAGGGFAPVLTTRAQADALAA